MTESFIGRLNALKTDISSRTQFSKVARDAIVEKLTVIGDELDAHLAPTGFWGKLFAFLPSARRFKIMLVQDMLDDAATRISNAPTAGFLKLEEREYYLTETTDMLDESVKLLGEVNLA